VTISHGAEIIYFTVGNLHKTNHTYYLHNRYHNCRRKQSAGGLSSWNNFVATREQLQWSSISWKSCINMLNWPQNWIFRYTRQYNKGKDKTP
jgi:hypothetical protein